MDNITGYFHRFRPRTRGFLGVILGLIVGLGQAPFSLPFLAVFGLGFSFLLFGAAQSVKQAFWIGWAVGVGYFGLVLSWIIEPFLVDAARYGWMAPFALLGMAGGMALFWGAAFGFARRFGGAFALAVFWAIAELVRSYVLTGFPWGLLAYIWLDTGFSQWVAYVGPHGLTLITLLFVWAGIFALTHPKRLIFTPLLFLVFVMMLAFGAARSQFYWMPDEQRAKSHPRPIIRLIQPNAPQDKKWDPEYSYDYFIQSLKFTAAKGVQKPDLIVWPETAVPFLLNNAPKAIQTIARAARNTPVIVGIQRFEDRQYFNSLMVIDAIGEITDIYDKTHLVPFGEYAPGGALSSSLGFKGFAANDGYAFGAGDGLRALELPKLGRFLPLICYESIFPDEILAAAADAQWMLHITNDAWFGNFSGPYQHLAQARFRAIEQGKPVARAANTGVSAMIDARGNITKMLGLNKAGYLDAPLPRATGKTLYSKTRDLPIFILLIALVSIVLRRAALNKH